MTTYTKIPIRWATYKIHDDLGSCMDYRGYPDCPRLYDNSHLNPYFAGIPSDTAYVVKVDGIGTLRQIIFWDYNVNEPGDLYLRSNGVPKIELWTSDDNLNWSWAGAVEQHPCDWASAFGGTYPYDYGTPADYPSLPATYAPIDGLYANGLIGAGNNVGSGMMFYRNNRYLQGLKVYDSYDQDDDVALYFEHSGHHHHSAIQVWSSFDGINWVLIKQFDETGPWGTGYPRTYDAAHGFYYYYLNTTLAAYPLGVPCRWFKVRYSTDDSWMRYADGVGFDYPHIEIIPTINLDPETALYDPRILYYTPYLPRVYYTAGGFYKTTWTLPMGLPLKRYLKIRFHSAHNNSLGFFLLSPTGSYKFPMISEIELYGDYERDDFPVLPFEPDWSDPVTVRRGYQTTTQTAVSGPEVRTALHQRVRLGSRYSLPLLNDENLRWLRRRLMEYPDQAWGFPVWPGRVELTAAGDADTNLLAVTETTDRFFDDAVYVVLIDPDDLRHWEYHVVSEVTANEITLFGNLSGTWPIGTWVLPMFRAWLPTFNLKLWAALYGGTSVNVDEAACKVIYV